MRQRPLSSYLQHTVPSPPGQAVARYDVTTEAFYELRESSQRVDRLYATLDSLVLLHGTLEASQESATPREAALLQNLHDLAVRDIGAIDTDISLEGLTVSQEGLGVTVRKLIEAIITALRKFAEKIGQFFRGLASDTLTLKVRLHEFELHLNEIEGKQPTVDKVKFGNEIYGIATDHGAPTDGSTLLRLLVELDHQSALILKEWMPGVALVGDRLEPILRKEPTTPEAAEAWVGELNAAAATLPYQQVARGISKLHKVLDSRFPIDAALAGPPLPGRHSLIFVDGFKQTGQTDTVFETAAAWQAMRIDLVEMSPGHDTKHDAVMECMSVHDLREVIHHIHAYIERLDYHASHLQANGIVASSKQMQAALTSLASSNDAVNQGIATGLRYVTVYRRWLKTPSTEMLNLLYTVSKAAMAVCENHARQYR